MMLTATLLKTQPGSVGITFGIDTTASTAAPSSDVQLERRRSRADVAEDQAECSAASDGGVPLDDSIKAALSSTTNNTSSLLLRFRLNNASATTSATLIRRVLSDPRLANNSNNVVSQQHRQVTLDFERCGLDDAALQTLLPLLNQYYKPSVLLLAGNHLSARSLKAVLEDDDASSSWSSNLTHLGITSNPIGNAGLDSLTRFIERPDCKLEKLHATRISWTRASARDGNTLPPGTLSGASISKFGAAVAASKTLSVVYFKQQETDGAASAAELLAGSETIVSG